MELLRALADIAFNILRTISMKGTLVDQPLAELIREISVKNLSGTLRLEHERVQTAVYFENGQVVYAAANLRTLRLREYLTKRAVVSQSVLARFENNLSDLDFASALAASGTLRQKDIDALLTILVSDVLRVALLWTDGAWEFNERARLADPVKLNLDTATLLREAAQRTRCVPRNPLSGAGPRTVPRWRPRPGPHRSRGCR